MPAPVQAEEFPLEKGKLLPETRMFILSAPPNLPLGSLCMKMWKMVRLLALPMVRCIGGVVGKRRSRAPNSRRSGSHRLDVYGVGAGK